MMFGMSIVALISDFKYAARPSCECSAETEL